MRYEVTEHQVLESCCTCGKRYRGDFPASVRAAVQYGPYVKAAAVHLSEHHMLPAQRTADVIGELCGLQLSDATVLAAVSEAKKRLEPTVAVIGKAVVAAQVAHADETGMRVAGKLHWVHVLTTELLTWMGIHPKRGKKKPLGRVRGVGVVCVICKLCKTRYLTCATSAASPTPRLSGM